MTPDMKAALEQEGRRSGSPWKSISSAPKDGREILACQARVSGGLMQVVYWEDGWCTNDSDLVYQFGFFTHWTDLPEPPPPQGAETHE